MQDPLSIAQGRLANGEITVEEYERLVEVLSRGDSKTSRREPPPTVREALLPPPVPPAASFMGQQPPAWGLAPSPQSARAKRSGSKPWLVAGGVVLGLFVFLMVVGYQIYVSGLSINNLAAIDNVVSLRVVNERQTDGDYVLEVTQDQATLCQVMGHIPARSAKSVSFVCGPGAIRGQFSAKALWADDTDRGKYPVLQD